MAIDVTCGIAPELQHRVAFRIINKYMARRNAWVSNKYLIWVVDLWMGARTTTARKLKLQRKNEPAARSQELAKARRELLEHLCHDFSLSSEVAGRLTGTSGANVRQIWKAWGHIERKALVDPASIIRSAKDGRLQIARKLLTSGAAPVYAEHAATG
jgi:hypothetical protein